jgi:hypothetical protein
MLVKSIFGRAFAATPLAVRRVGSTDEALALDAPAKTNAAAAAPPASTERRDTNDVRTSSNVRLLELLLPMSSESKLIVMFPSGVDM